MPIAFVLSRYTGIHVLVIYACVQLADLIKCVIGFVLVKEGCVAAEYCFIMIKNFNNIWLD